jgi:hypothetical protein
MAQSFDFADPQRDAQGRVNQALSQRGNASVAGGASAITRLMQQMQGSMNYGALDREALKGINNAEGNVESVFRNQLQGFHENTGGSLLAQLANNRKALQARGLGGATALLGDMGTDRNYKLTMGKLQDTWLSNLLGQKTGFMKQRTGVANSASSRLSQVLAQLAGTSAGLINSNTPTQSWLPQAPQARRLDYSTNY